MNIMNSEQKTYSTISEMLNAEGASAELVAGYKKEVEDTRLITELVKLRSKRSKTQKDLSEALGCTQSRVSKIESADDSELTIGYLKKYAEALQFNLIVTFIPKEIPAVDRIKYHALQIEKDLAALAQLANGDAELSGSIGSFFGESLYNLIHIVARQARKLPGNSAFDVQVVESEPDRQASAEMRRQRSRSGKQSAICR